MPGHTKLPHRQEVFLAALLSTPTIAQAAKQAKIAETTATRWLKDQAFQAQYREAKAQMVGEATSYLQQTMLAAVAVLRHTMLADTTRPAQKIMAARSILELGLRTYELQDLESRIAALEAVRGAQ